VNGSSPASTPTSVDGRTKSPSSTGYHPPLPPKPQHFAKSSRDVVTEVATVDAAERELLRELLFVFQGIEGVILKRDAHSEGGFTLHPNYREKFSPSVVQLTLRLAELGYMFNVIHQFCENKISEKEIGLIRYYDFFPSQLKAKEINHKIKLKPIYCKLCSLDAPKFQRFTY
jgi:hypothetical protein